MFSATLSKTAAPLTVNKRFWQQSINHTNKPGFFKAVKNDRGTALLVVANSFAGGLVLIFAGRKILYHPDVLVANQSRIPSVYNETPHREDCSDSYIKQTAFFADTFARGASPIIKSFTGTTNPVWDLDFTRRNMTTIDIPLEHTSHFDDGLFINVPPGPLKSAHSSRREAL